MSYSASVGNAVRSVAKFTNLTRAPQDPTTILCRVQSPDGSEMTLTYGVDTAVIKDATGTYHYDLLFTAAGTYTIRWVGTGAVAAANEQSFPVTVSKFASP